VQRRQPGDSRQPVSAAHAGRPFALSRTGTSGAAPADDSRAVGRHGGWRPESGHPPRSERSRWTLCRKKPGEAQIGFDLFAFGNPRADIPAHAEYQFLPPIYGAIGADLDIAQAAVFPAVAGFEMIAPVIDG